MNRVSPGGSGELTDPEGHSWSVRRRKLDPRRVRSMLRRDDLPVLLGESGGFELRWVGDEERSTVAELVLKSYGWDNTWIGHEFADIADRRLLYLEATC